MSVPCSFEALKQREGPPFNAWGLYGDDDELGRLNLITPDAVQRGRDAIKQGRAINLKYEDLFIAGVELTQAACPC